MPNLDQLMRGAAEWIHPLPYIFIPLHPPLYLNWRILLDTPSKTNTMRDAIEFPFDASKYAFRTNFDGLTASDDAMKKRVDDLATKYKTALENFESDDKDAREDHRKEKEDGCTEEFKDWVGVNVSWSGSGVISQPCWSIFWLTLDNYMYSIHNGIRQRPT